MRVAVLSPHRDDAAFSCGLTLHSLLEAGSNLTIINVCTISRYAPYLTMCVGEVTDQVSELRRNEDAIFIETLRHKTGADSDRVQLVDLAWKDVPVRWCMEDDLALAPMNLLADEVENLRTTFQALPSFDIVFVPMALGGHLDHRLVFQAAVRSFPIESLVFYEDLPYACRMSAPERTFDLFESGTLLSEVWLPLQVAHRGLKREYALCYPSQIANEVAEEMENYALEHGGRERFFADAEAMRMLTTALRNEAVS